jgi:hypothetical protein
VCIHTTSHDIYFHKVSKSPNSVIPAFYTTENVFTSMKFEAYQNINASF